MNAVVFYSNTGESKAVAAYFADQLGYPLADNESNSENVYQNLVTYCKLTTKTVMINVCFINISPL